MTATLEVVVSPAGVTVTVALRGELDISTTAQLEASLPPVPPGARCVIDLTGLEFMDSAGIHSFMRLDTRARTEGWTLVLRRGPGMVGRLLDLCHFGERVAIEEIPG
jgi:anti-anti-sigma factor